MTAENRQQPLSDATGPQTSARSGAVSGIDVETDFVTGVYERLAAVYDLTFGPALHPGRLQALKRMQIRPGDRILEVGVGTGINATLYPRDCDVTGIDLSPSMLARARRRVARKHITNVRLMLMNAAALSFADDCFDIVYAPYVISVVPDPVKVAAEMMRVCKRGGRVIFLNHFLSPNRLTARMERAISPLTRFIGFKSDLDLQAFLDRAGLRPVSIEKVNIPRIHSLVTCVKP